MANSIIKSIVAVLAVVGCYNAPHLTTDLDLVILIWLAIALTACVLCVTCDHLTSKTNK